MINNISYLTGIIQPQNLHQRKNISFGQNIQTLTHTNIGSCLEGYIGKIRVRKRMAKFTLMFSKNISVEMLKTMLSRMIRMKLSAA